MPREWRTEGPLLLGEIHGTEETARAVLAILCEAAHDGDPVRLALEIPRDEQAAIDAYLAGGDPTRLLRGEHWTRAYQDGRSSQAMLRLIESVRRLRREGALITILAYDVAEGTRTEDRDLAMAERIAKAIRERPARTVVLVGNIHARTTVALPRPMGWRLKQTGLQPRSLLIEAEEGEAWFCQTLDPQSCGPRRAGRASRGPAPIGEISTGVTGVRGYDARLVLPRFTASPPAVERTAEAEAAKGVPKG